MAHGIENMIYVGETPWHGLGKQFQQPPCSASELIETAKLNWNVASEPMCTKSHGAIKGYHSVYRVEDMRLLSVINRQYPTLVQNVDAFTAFDPLINASVDVETAASINNGIRVFTCFKVRSEYKVLDDDVDHYFVVLNDHSKSDGKITVLNTPVRVVCQNTLQSAIHKNYYQLRVPVSTDTLINQTTAVRMLESVDSAIVNLNKVADKWATTIVDTSLLERILDELFPFERRVGEPILSTAHNDKVEQTRYLFEDLCSKPDLSNYNNSLWQLYNATIDYNQHYFSKVDKAYDIDSRLSRIGIGATETSLEQKFLRIARSIV